jgi:hypothetical protein
LLAGDFESPPPGLDFVLHPCERLGNLGVVDLIAGPHIHQHRARIGEEQVVLDVTMDNALYFAPDREWLRHKESDR